VCTVGLRLIHLTAGLLFSAIGCRQCFCWGSSSVSCCPITSAPPSGGQRSAPDWSFIGGMLGCQHRRADARYASGRSGSFRPGQSMLLHSSLHRSKQLRPRSPSTRAATGRSALSWSWSRTTSPRQRRSALISWRCALLLQGGVASDYGTALRIEGRLAWQHILDHPPAKPTHHMRAAVMASLLCATLVRRVLLPLNTGAGLWAEPPQLGGCDGHRQALPALHPGLPGAAPAGLRGST